MFHFSLICRWKPTVFQNIESLKSAKDMAVAPPYSFDRKEKPSIIHTFSSSRGFTNFLRAALGFRTKLILLLHHDRFMECCHIQREHVLQACPDVSLPACQQFSWPQQPCHYISSLSHGQILFQQKNSTEMFVSSANTCMWMQPCYISSRWQLMMITSASSCA